MADLPEEEQVLIDILLSTFNGERYLGELIDSLLNQTCENWILMIRDDGSSDGTLGIIHSYLSGYPGKIHLVEDGEKRLGACQSFARLLSRSKADYTMFCDQDDVWFPNKIETTLGKIEACELEDKSVPVLVHTDLKVVERDLKIRSESLFKFQNIGTDLKTLNHLLVMNIATGCTMMINRKLRERIHSIPDTAIIHDWWIALAAAAFGRIECIGTPTVLYRQHGDNEIGAVRYVTRYFVPRFPEVTKAMILFERVAEQAAGFLRIYRNQLSGEQVELLDNFSNIFRKGRWKRLSTLIKYEISGTGLTRNLGIAALVLLVRRRR